MVEIFLICLAIGSLVGFLAGLLGIGGGLIIVPALIKILPFVVTDKELVMPMALATSLATIVVTTVSAAIAHHINKNIPWKETKQLMFFVGSGALLGAFIADGLSSKTLEYFFASSVFLLSLYMFFSLRAATEREVTSTAVYQTIAFFTGIAASLMGISGGAILIPALTFCGMSIRLAIGISTVCGMMVALFGSFGYIISGLGHPNLPAWSLGYVYLPALLGISISSTLFAPKGVRLAARLPVRRLKKIFASFLMLVAIEIVLTSS
ncbi:sulfite exporter TauE/SafE family protein [Thalassotalea agarivorans]|uniref:Probable membrane transporter protein n=1 Tax=Thalassotalea agarivorans TaxID=349064 RepID=A0A1H9ZHY5_THASX|nr:sulfite exporter TauE/SafE family protein [Thalassotalea agarivorans]SES81215.1 hypothetical protein SAMN05660429_00456 [Thalassotalea agarivorans]